MDRPEQVRLGAEAQYLHALLFDRPAPPEVVDRYIRANVHCGFPGGPEMEVILHKALDAEAIEFARRLLWRDTRLTRKFQILFFLIEVRREYYGEFVNEERRQGWPLAAELARLAAGSGWKLVKGVWLVWRHGLG